MGTTLDKYICRVIFTLCTVPDRTCAAQRRQNTGLSSLGDRTCAQGVLCVPVSPPGAHVLPAPGARLAAELRR